jgi:uncharacterized membrane protein
LMFESRRGVHGRRKALSACRSGPVVLATRGCSHPGGGTVNARRVATAGVIAAVYGALTFLVIQLGSVFSYGIIQFRVSEALTVVAVLTPAAVPGLAIGSALANLSSVGMFGALGLLDVTFGSLATLLAAMWSWRFRRRTWLALLGPVVFNALIVPAYLPAMLGATGLTTIPALGITAQSSWPVLYLTGVLTVGFGQAVVVYGMRLPGLEGGDA